VRRVEVVYRLDATESALLPMSEGGYREEIGNGQTMGQPGMEMYLQEVRLDGRCICEERDEKRDEKRGRKGERGRWRQTVR